MNSIILIRLGQVYRAELLGVKAIQELMGTIVDRQTERILMETLEFHKSSIECLSEVFEELSFTPGEDIVLPERVQMLLTMKNFPERMLCSWLNEFEIQLRDHYQRIILLLPSYKKVLPRTIWKSLVERAELQVGMSLRMTEIMNNTTMILEPAPWDVEESLTNIA